MQIFVWTTPPVLYYTARMIPLKFIILAVALVMYALVIAFQEKKVFFTTGAAVLVILLGTILPGAIFRMPQGYPGSARLYALLYSLTQAVNWNVLLIYIGSMAIAALFIYSKVPARIADAIVAGCSNTGVAIVAILAMTGIISIFVENVATVLVMAPIALALCRKLNLKPVNFMVGLSVMSNLEGTATLVGDPPSMIFASFAGYNFNDFFILDGTLSIFFVVQTGMLAGCLFFYAFFARAGRNRLDMEKTQVISWLPFILLLLMIFGLAAISFIPVEIKFLSGLFVFTLGMTGLVWYKLVQKKSRSETMEMIRGLDWETIGFLIGIFIVIAAIQQTGLLEDFARFLAGITGGSKLAGFIIILLVSVAISGFVDNVPYIIAMLPVAASLAGNMGLKRELYMFALLVGSCLGGNLTPFGASANIVSMGILKKEGYPMSFAGWLKLGVPFTVITTAAAGLALWLLWA